MQSFDRCEECIHVAVDDDPLIHEANPLTAVIEDWPVFLLLTSVILHRVIFERDEAVHACRGNIGEEHFHFRNAL